MRCHLKNLDVKKIKHITSDDGLASISDESMSSMADDIGFFLCKQKLQTKKLKISELKRLMKDVDDKISSRTLPIKAIYKEEKSSKLKKDNDVFTNIYIGLTKRADLSSSDHLVQLYSLKVVGGRKSILISYQPMPYAMQYHAASRLIERTKIDSGPISTLGNELYRWIPAIDAMLDQMTISDGASNTVKSHLAFPTESNSGILFGQFSDCGTSKGFIRIYNKQGVHDFTGNGSIMQPMFIVNTFVNKELLYDNQLELLDRLSVWRKTYDEENDILAEKIMVPQVSTKHLLAAKMPQNNESNLVGIELDYPRLSPEGLKALYSIMDDKSVTETLEASKNHNSYRIHQDFPNVSL